MNGGTAAQGVGFFPNYEAEGQHEANEFANGNFGLLEAALEWLGERGRTPVYLGVWSENDGAQRLYGRYGFEKVGEYDFPVGDQLDREFILKRSS